VLRRPARGLGPLVVEAKLLGIPIELTDAGATLDVEI